MSENKKTPKRIAVMTSGGDAPGMNAFVRSTVRRALSCGLEVFGIMEAYQGLIENKIEKLNYDCVCNLTKQGGTVLKTSRSAEFMTLAGQKKAAAVLHENKIDALICCGGNGSYKGLEALAKVWSGQVIGAPGTIDNDVRYTDFTIGFDTAVNTAMKAIDNLRDTGDSHDMHFLVEVMGRHCGDIAKAVGIACGAVDVLIPETPSNIDSVVNSIRRKGHNIIVVAEGDETGGVNQLAQVLTDAFHDKYPDEKVNFRICVLGHVQRGGDPSARDRILAHNMGEFCVDAILNKKHLQACAIQGKKLVLTDLS